MMLIFILYMKMVIAGLWQSLTWLQ